MGAMEAAQAFASKAARLTIAGSRRSLHPHPDQSRSDPRCRKCRRPRPEPRPQASTPAADRGTGPPALVQRARPGHLGPRVGLALPPRLLPGRPRRLSGGPRRGGPGSKGGARSSTPSIAIRSGAPEQLHVFAVPRPQGRLRRDDGRHRPEGDPRRPARHPGLGPRPGAGADLFVLLDHRDLRIRPDVEAYGKILRDREGVDPESSVYKTKVAAYADRLVPMNKQRLYPEFPDWPCLCFYPMSKMRQADQNWYTPAVRGADRS